MIEKTDRRKYFRIFLDRALCSEITVLQIKGVKVSSGYNRVCIHDIGPGGLRFSSNLNFPVHPDIILGFNVEVLSQIIKLQGSIVRKIEISPGKFEYGVQFKSLSDTTRSYLVKIFNILMVRLRKHVLLKSCKFCEKNNKGCWMKVG